MRPFIRNSSRFNSEGNTGSADSQREAQPSMLDVEFTQLTDPGRVRDHNEDFLGHVAPETPQVARSHGWLFVLADGVGGQEMGEVASKTAVECMLAGFRKATAGEPHSTVLSRLVQSANAQVYEKGRVAALGGVSMATTVVSCALRYDRASIAHVGDSRCYLVRHGHVTTLTRDHTVASEQLRMGVLTAREASEANTRHLLSRSVGNDLFVNVETSDHQVQPGDVLLTCSDGLHNSVKPQDIGAVLSHQPPLDTAAHHLVTLAKERDGSDNISVQLIRIRGVERVGMYRGRPYKLH